MKKLIEFKLHGGQLPYFVAKVLSGVDIGGKKYGVSLDTEESYLPDTVKSFTRDEFIEVTKTSDIWYQPYIEEEGRWMTENENIDYIKSWLNKHNIK